MKSELKIPTDRSFGYTFAVVFALLGGWMLWHANRLGFGSLAAAAVFGVIAVTIPRILHPLNVAWMYFGMVLNKIVSPIVLGIVFGVVILPVGLVFRWRGRDALHRSFEPKAKSYWIDRTPPGPRGDSFPRQF